MDNYVKARDTVFSYLQEKKRSSATIFRYEKCYDKLERYLEENGIPFSAEVAEEWMNKCLSLVSSASKNDFKTPILRLIDALKGEVTSRHFCESRLMTYGLNQEFALLLDEILENYKDMSKRTVKNRRFGLCRILKYFQEINIQSVEDITYDSLFIVLEKMDNGAYYSEIQNREMMNYLLTFLYGQNKVSFGFILFTHSLKRGGMKYWHFGKNEEIKSLKSVQQADTDEINCTLSELHSCTEILLESHDQYGYCSAEISTLSRASSALYLFLDYYQLCFCSETIDLWLTLIEPMLHHERFNMFRRTGLLLKQIHETGDFDVQSRFIYSQPAIYDLPDWCRIPALNYIELRQKEGWTIKTIEMIRASIFRFCSFLVTEQLTSFSQMSPEIIKQFNLTDKHSTPQGKNAYNCRIRKFLEYLGDKDLLENRCLSFSLSCASAPVVKPPVILSDEQYEELKNVLKSETNDVELRYKAIIRLGIDLGLRGIDIVNLEFEDINWEKATICLVQSKTSNGIELPMTDAVANAISNYILNERPDSTCRKIFIKHQAPYDSIGSVVCQKAMKAALPESNISNLSFHTARRTFATKLLNTGSTAQNVMEGLGHRNTANIKKYLSYNKKIMRTVPFSLKECGLEFQGGFPYEQ